MAELVPIPPTSPGVQLLLAMAKTKALLVHRYVYCLTKAAEAQRRVDQILAGCVCTPTTGAQHDCPVHHEHAHDAELAEPERARCRSGSR